MNYLALTRKDLEMEKRLLSAYKKTISTMPEGRLGVRKIRGKWRYYRINEKTYRQTYIPKSDLQLIHLLKQKRWMKKAVKIIEKNIKLQEEILKSYQPYNHNYIQKILPQPDSDSILDEYEQEVFPDLKKWSESAYRKNPYKPEMLRLKTSFGLRVRSKGELLIAELLHNYKIPFHYDAEIRLRDEYGIEKIRYVDFYIKFPDGGFIIWEHMGLFGKEDYRNDQFVKLTEYYENGIFTPYNFIITMDGPNGEFDYAAVERIIQGQILSRMQ